MKRLFVFALFAFLCVSVSFAYFADTDVEKKSVAIGIIDDNGESVISATGLMPVDSMNGFAAGYVARQTANKEVTSEVYVGRVQGGFDAGPARIRGYIEASRDLVQLIDLKIESGIFAETPDYAWQDVHFSFGGGNFMDQRSLDDKIGRDTDDKEVNFGFLVFGTAEYGKLNGVLRLKPNFDFDDFASEFAVSWNEEVTEDIGIQVAGLFKYDSASVADSLWSRSIQFLLTYSPE